MVGPGGRARAGPERQRTGGADDAGAGADVGPDRTVTPGRRARLPIRRRADRADHADQRRVDGRHRGRGREVRRLARRSPCPSISRCSCSAGWGLSSRLRCISRFRVPGSGFRVPGSGSGCRVRGSGFQGSRFGVPVGSAVPASSAIGFGAKTPTTCRTERTMNRNLNPEPRTANPNPDPGTQNPGTRTRNPEPGTPNPDSAQPHKPPSRAERAPRTLSSTARDQPRHRRHRRRVLRLVERQPSADEYPALRGGIAAVDQPVDRVLRQQIDRGSAVAVLDEPAGRSHPLNEVASATHRQAAAGSVSNTHEHSFLPVVGSLSRAPRCEVEAKIRFASSCRPMASLLNRPILNCGSRRPP